jgi:hypothetical protein
MALSWRWLLVPVALVAGIAIVSAVTRGSSTSPSAGASALPKPAASSGAPGSVSEPSAPSVASSSLTSEQAVGEAESALRRFLRTSDTIMQRGDGDSTPARAVARGFVLGEVEAAAQERKDLTLRQTGSVDVVTVAPTQVELSGAEPVVVLSACLDVSAIDFLDGAGRSQKARLYQPSAPVQHLYGVQRVGQTWFVSTHSIPASSNCASQ